MDLVAVSFPLMGANFRPFLKDCGALYLIDSANAAGVPLKNDMFQSQHFSGHPIHPLYRAI
jgi:hypothetical protein